MPGPLGESRERYALCCALSFYTRTCPFIFTSFQFHFSFKHLFSFQADQLQKCQGPASSSGGLNCVLVSASTRPHLRPRRFAEAVSIESFNVVSTLLSHGLGVITSSPDKTQFFLLRARVKLNGFADASSLERVRILVPC